jgi:uncharacterized phiE125 gp8 family phage protein
VLSAAEVLEPATAEPITRDQVKTFLRIDGDALDAELDLMLAAAVEELELLTALRLMDQVVRLRATSFADLEHLTIGPVRELVAIGAKLPGGEFVPLDLADYELTGADLHRGIAPIAGRVAFSSIPTVVDVRVGYGGTAQDVPASLRLALLTMVRGRYDDRPVDVERLIANYRLNA